MLNIIKKLLNYIIVGGIATIVDYSIFYICIYNLTINTSIAILIASLIGCEANYLASSVAYPKQNISVIKSFLRHHQSMLLALTANITTMFILAKMHPISHLMISQFIVETFNISYLFLCKMIATTLSFLINFIFISFYAFNGKISIRKIFKNFIFSQ